MAKRVTDFTGANPFEGGSETTGLRCWAQFALTPEQREELGLAAKLRGTNVNQLCVVALGAGLEGVLSELRGLTDEQRAALVPQAKPTTNGSGKTRSKVTDINDPAKLEKMIADKQRASQNAAAAVEAAKARLEQLKSGIVPTVDPEDELGGEDEGDEDESEE
jgi:hypothetical protein